MKKYLYALLCLMSMPVFGQSCNDSIIASTPDNRFMINGAEITDTQTGLIWQRCSLGQSGSDCSSGSIQSYTWQQALAAAEHERQQTAKHWRLPNIKELRSIVEEKCLDPSINATVFPITNSLAYWSASPSADLADNAWTLYFFTGISYSDDKTSAFSVRLVRTRP